MDEEEYLSDEDYYPESTIDISTTTDKDLLLFPIKLMINSSYIFCPYHLKNSMIECSMCDEDVDIEDVKTYCFNCSFPDLYKLTQDELLKRGCDDKIVKEYENCQKIEGCLNSLERNCYKCKENKLQTLPCCKKCLGITPEGEATFFKDDLDIERFLELIENIKM